MMKIIKPQPKQSTLQDVSAATIFTLKDDTFLRINTGATTFENRQFINLSTGRFAYLHNASPTDIVHIYLNTELTLQPPESS